MNKDCCKQAKESFEKEREINLYRDNYDEQSFCVGYYRGYNDAIEKACEWFNKWQGNMAACKVHACNIEWWTNQMRKDLEEELC